MAEIDEMESGRPGMLRGHQIYRDGREWRYADNDAPTAATHQSRDCGVCGRRRTQDGHDGCPGTLAGVANACCGHGDEAAAYVQFCDGSIVRGKNAVVGLLGLTAGAKEVRNG